MIKRLIKLFHKTRKVNEPTKEQFLYYMSFENQNKYCLNHNVSFKQAINDFK